MKLIKQVNSDWQFYKVAEKRGGMLEPLRHAGFYIVVLHRYGQWTHELRSKLPRKLNATMYRMAKVVVEAFTGVDLKAGAKVGERFHVHTCHGIIIADEVQLGHDVLVNSGTCIVHGGDSRGKGAPVVGTHVRFGVGSKAVGDVTIGDHCIIGANAVVTRDIPPRSVAVGVPARAHPAPPEFLAEVFSENYQPYRAGLIPEGLYERVELDEHAGDAAGNEMAEKQ